MGAGIDYGRGVTNIDHKTGIRYGVIPQNDVIQAWADSSEPDYSDCEHGKGLCDEDECADFAEPLAYLLTDEEYTAQSDNEGDIFIMRSPYYTLARFCSPCAPGAGYLRNPDPDYGVKTYCFGHDWFEDGRAPYTVYNVATGKEVSP